MKRRLVVAAITLICVAAGAVVTLGLVTRYGHVSPDPATMPTFGQSQPEAISCRQRDANWGEVDGPTGPTPGAAIADWARTSGAATEGYRRIADAEAREYWEVRTRDGGVAAGVEVTNAAEGWKVTWFQFCDGATV